jgi:hypothetical protein
VGFVGREYADHRVHDLLGLPGLQGTATMGLVRRTAVLAGIGGLLTLGVVHAQQLSFAWRA